VGALPERLLSNFFRFRSLPFRGRCDEMLPLLMLPRRRGVHPLGGEQNHHWI
jgi:hypothetical protein